jgi:hypothetical protein
MCLGKLNLILVQVRVRQLSMEHVLVFHIRADSLSSKADIVVPRVQILKQEWPHNWKDFIPQLVESGKTNETLCGNNMDILKKLSEEVGAVPQRGAKGLHRA